MVSSTSPELRWIKIDLHVHTPASEDYAEKNVQFIQILHEAEQRGIHMLAFTDHNTVAGYEQLQREVEFLQQIERTNRATAADTEQLNEYLRLLGQITVLPGFEFTSHYGAHILAVFPDQTPVSVIEATLLRLGIPTEKIKAGVTAVPNTAHVTEAYEIISKAGGLVIAAHANGPNGVISETLRMGTSGQSRVAATQSLSLAALEFINFYTDHNTFTSPGFYNGKTEHYERRIFCIQGSDAHRVRRAPSGSDVAHRHGIGDRYFEALLPSATFAALHSLFTSTDFDRLRVPKRDQKQWDIDQLRFGKASDHNILRNPDVDERVLLRDIVALCNIGGGTLILGAGNDGTGQVKGVAQPTDVSEQLRLAADQHIEPTPLLNMELVRYEGRDVLRVEVRTSHVPPYVLDGQVWSRRDAATVPANRGEIIQLARRALAESGMSPLDNGEEWDFPRSGVEIVEEERRDGEYCYEIRDLRTIPNVVRERAQGLWAYAIDRHIDVRDRRVPLEAQIKWSGQLGLWRMYRQGNQLKYDLVHRDPNGVIDHIFYGVTDWGLSPSWSSLLEQVRASDANAAAGPTSEQNQVLGDLVLPSDSLPRTDATVVPVRSVDAIRADLLPVANAFGGRRVRWLDREGIVRIERQPDGTPAFDLALRNGDGAIIQQFPHITRLNLNEPWMAAITTDRPRTGIEVVSYNDGEDGVVRLTFRDLRTGEASPPWRIEELKEGSVREYAARMYLQDRPLNESVVRWLGNLGYLRPMRSQVDLVYRDVNGVDHLYYACRRDELRGPWKQLLEAWEEPTGISATRGTMSHSAEDRSWPQSALPSLHTANGLSQTDSQKAH
ncbi:MAG: putative DNA binding domain-containing protein [Herpetosiphon sp.]